MKRKFSAAFTISILIFSVLVLILSCIAYSQIKSNEVVQMELPDGTLATIYFAEYFNNVVSLILAIIGVSALTFVFSAVYLFYVFVLSQSKEDRKRKRLESLNKKIEKIENQ